MASRRKGWPEASRGRLGRVHDYGLQYVPLYLPLLPRLTLYQSTSLREQASRTHHQISTFTNSQKCVCLALCVNAPVANTDQASRHIIQFMKNFYSVFPEYKQMDVRAASPPRVLHSSSRCRHTLAVKVTQGNTFRILVSTKHSPTPELLSDDVLSADAILNTPDLGIPLRGAAIGNGWIDSRTQYPSYLDYAVKHGILEENSDACVSRFLRSVRS